MQEISLFKKNILLFLDSQKIRKSEFYRLSGITRGVLDHSSGLSEDNVTKFIATYPNVNIDWFLTGKGEMLLSDEGNSVSELKKNKECVQCEILERENGFLKEIIKAKEETIKALQDKDSKGSSKRQHSA